MRSNRKTTFEPMKAFQQNPSDELLSRWFDTGLELWVTDKFDGIRCLNMDAGAMSRTMKPIPNVQISTFLHQRVPIGFDGELMTETGSLWSDSTSHIMSRYSVGDFTYHVFDDVTVAHLPYSDRVERLRKFAAISDIPHVRYEFPRVVTSLEALKKEENEAVEERGREGLILRVPWQVYKYGRSTLGEAGMLKLKRWSDDEAKIIGFEPLRHNLNEATKDAFGRQERGRGMAGMVESQMLGAFIVEHPVFGVFNIGGPFTHLQRCNFWLNRNVLIGQMVTFKYQKHGTEAKPRNPKYHRVRMD